MSDKEIKGIPHGYEKLFPADTPLPEIHRGGLSMRVSELERERDEARAEVETWKDRAAMNGKKAFEHQDERDTARADLATAQARVKELEESLERLCEEHAGCGFREANCVEMVAASELERGKLEAILDDHCFCDEDPGLCDICEARSASQPAPLLEAAKELALNLARVMAHWKEERAVQGHKEAETTEAAYEALAAWKAAGGT